MDQTQSRFLGEETAPSLAAHLICTFGSPDLRRHGSTAAASGHTVELSQELGKFRDPQKLHLFLPLLSNLTLQWSGEATMHKASAPATPVTVYVKMAQESDAVALAKLRKEADLYQLGLEGLENAGRVPHFYGFFFFCVAGKGAFGISVFEHCIDANRKHELEKPSNELRKVIWSTLHRVHQEEGLVHNRLLKRDPITGIITLRTDHIGLDSAGNPRIVGWSGAHTSHRALLKIQIPQKLNISAHAHAPTRTPEGRIIKEFICCSENKNIGSALEAAGGCYELECLKSWNATFTRDRAISERYMKEAKMYDMLLDFVTMGKPGIDVPFLPTHPRLVNDQEAINSTVLKNA